MAPGLVPGRRRSALQVRPATPEDVPALVDLAEELMPNPAETSRLRGTPAGARAALEQRYAEALDDPDRHLVVVVNAAEEPLGMALLTIASANALCDLPAVHMGHAVVSDRHKRRGAGKALVAAAAAFAESHGLEQIVVSVQPGSRDANRFFARLGFAPIAVRRVAPVAVVRRHLAHADSQPSEHAVRRRPRRTSRRTTAALGPAGAEADAQ